MADYSGKKHFVSALMRRYTDRVPVTTLIGPYCSRLTNYSVKEILQDAKKSTEAHLAFYDRFAPDSVIIYNDIYLEVEALGCELEFPEDNISHPKTVLLDDKSQLAHLKIPDPKRDGRIPYFIEVCERVSAQVRKTAALGLGHSRSLEYSHAPQGSRITSAGHVLGRGVCPRSDEIFNRSRPNDRRRVNRSRFLTFPGRSRRFLQPYFPPDLS